MKQLNVGEIIEESYEESKDGSSYKGSPKKPVKKLDFNKIANKKVEVEF